jgi:hypothetical protein
MNLSEKIEEFLLYHARHPTRSTDDSYQSIFSDEGLRKARYVIDDIAKKAAHFGLDLRTLSVLSIGGADGSEIEALLTETGIPRGILLEWSPSACNVARARAQSLEERNKQLKVLEGDALDRLDDAFASMKADGVKGLVISAQAILHELPSRSSTYTDENRLLGKLFSAFPATLFYAREPCRPRMWPEEVEFHIPGVKAERICRLLKMVGSHFRLPTAGIQEQPGNYVIANSVLVVEVLHKLLRCKNAEEFEYEMGEQLTSFDGERIEKLLIEFCEDASRVTTQLLATEGFHKSYADAGILARSPAVPKSKLHLPYTHVLFQAIRVSSETEVEARGTTSDDGKPSSTEAGLPSGWEIVDRDVLAEARADPPTLEVMVQFFDGILPTWRLALASGVRSRAVAERLANRFRAIHDGASKPAVVLLTGAGGEGKSTAVLHAAAALAEDPQQAWTCLRRQAANAELPEATFSKLPIVSGHAWVVVIDDADNIGPAIIAAVKKVAARTDVHLLLAARDAEWQLKRLLPGMWQPVADFHTEFLAGLDREDARRIVAGWAAWGDEAMGKLKGRSEEVAATALLGHARDFAARREDGDLLGALLVTRQGEDMRAHVRTLVNGLGQEPVIASFSLRDVYAMVAAMHAENQLYLSRSVLAFALGCNMDELERKALYPLRREAMLDTGEHYVLTRHRRIAEAACMVLREDHYDLDRWYSRLAGAAQRDFTTNFTRDPDIAHWVTGLAEHFVSKGDRGWNAASAIAKAVWDAQPKNAYLLTAYSSVLRRTGRPREAMAALKTSIERFRNERSLLREWATVAGEIGDYGLNAWLAGRALSDGGELTAKDCQIGLAGLGVALREMFMTSREKMFAKGQAACGQLGLRLEELDTTGYLEKHAAEGRSNDIAELSPEQAVEAIRRAIILGANEVGPDNDPVFFEKLLGDPDGYRYTALLRRASGTSPALQPTKYTPAPRK